MFHLILAVIQFLGLLGALWAMIGLRWTYLVKQACDRVHMRWLSDIQHHNFSLCEFYRAKSDALGLEFGRNSPLYWTRNWRRMKHEGHIAANASATDRIHHA